MSITIKPASFNLLRYISSGLGAYLTLYCIVGLIPWSTNQPTLCECNPLDYLILGLGHLPIITCTSPHEKSIIFTLLTYTLDVGIGDRAVTIRARTCLRRFVLNYRKCALQVLYFLVPITVVASPLIPCVGLIFQFLAPVIYFFLEFPA